MNQTKKSRFAEGFALGNLFVGGGLGFISVVQEQWFLALFFYTCALLGYMVLRGQK